MDPLHAIMAGGVAQGAVAMILTSGSSPDMAPMDQMCPTESFNLAIMETFLDLRAPPAIGGSPGG
jgi:hypothetical protein